MHITGHAHESLGRARFQCSLNHGNNLHQVTTNFPPVLTQLLGATDPPAFKIHLAPRAYRAPNRNRPTLVPGPPLSNLDDQATQAGPVEFPGFFRRNCRIRKKMRLGFP